AGGREDQGWRSGRPFEDPDKIKRWGFVSAKPSEYLIHVRRGKLTSRTGQGSSCFKWPWDSVAIVPTSLQRLSFRADQVTSEKVGVEVVGLAVYRIAEPLLAFRVLNFSYPERAQEKLVETLTGMFVGATRRIVATLGVEDCLRRRKSALGEELLREIAPVVGGEGSPDDVTARGWGVVIDTIEIQEVRVLSETVFAAMQAPYRAHLDRQAREARALAEQAIAEREAACRRETELQRLRVEAELEEASAERAAQQAVRAAELATAEAEALLASHEQRLRAQQSAGELERATALLNAELARVVARVERDQRIATHIGSGESPLSQLAAALLTFVDIRAENRADLP
ncbi:MAG TPA: SPFH domain-containing protein, partial [Polyangiaceae bacterium]|nr:SPFH domain-containing protein [Polyangiaceae bacterium]